MPICPRCGRHMSSEQALMYHLNKKYKCCTWKCYKCNENFNTKFQLQLHEMLCINDIQTPIDTEHLMKVYNNLPIPIIEYNELNQVQRVNPKAIEIFTKDIIQKNIDTLKLDDKFSKCQHVDNLIFCI